MSLTFVACYRGRDVQRLKRSLDSLKDQTCPDFEMILVDYGSHSACSSEIRQLLGDYSFCRYCYSDTRGWMWNRSAALNTGARLTDREFLFLTDVDIVYPPWFVERVREHMAKDVFFASECFRCPKGFDSWVELRRGSLSHAWLSLKGKGLACCARSGLEAVGGLDERYGYWGQQDKDFVERLARSGTRDLAIPDLYCYHQWHPHVIYELPFSVQFNTLVRYYGAQAEARVKANERREWGKPVHSEDRPIYAFVDPEKGVLRPGSPVRITEAFGVASLLTMMNEIATTKNVVWAFPSYDASDRDATLLNKVLRRFGWRLNRRLGYADDFARGFSLAVPEFFRDYYLEGKIGRQPYSFFLT